MRTLSFLLLLAILAAPAAAQEREIRDANLPRSLETRLLRMYDGGAERVDGPITIAVGQVRAGDLAVMGGAVRVAGRLDGDLAVIDGDVIMEPGGVVAGSIVVLGGAVRMADDAVVDGTITVYGAAEGWRNGRARSPDERVRWRDRGRERDDAGYSRLTVRTGVSYNRVEGLPIMVGPVLETAGPMPLRIEALGIWRTAGGVEGGAERTGYQVRAEQFLSRGRSVSLGGGVHSVVTPVERWHMSDLEASLGTVLLHYDPRDHYDRTGWTAFARVRPGGGVDARLTYRDETHGALAAADPWALFNRSDAWRPQPLVAEGRVRSVEGSLEMDRRDRRQDPRTGWFARVAVERPVGGALAVPELELVGSPATILPEAPVDLDFTTGFLDLRHYSPVTGTSQLGLRGVVGGALTERALPPQYQHALGGPGTLPGFPLFHGGCGARALAGVRDGHTFLPGYGCDRFVLGQVEYRGGLSLDFGFGEPRDGHRHDRAHRWWDGWWHDVDVDLEPTWVVFANAGRGWSFGEPDGPVPVVDTGAMADAGIGFLLGRLGIYAAVPLTGDLDRSPRFFLRWGARF